MLMHALDKGWTLITAWLSYAHNQWITANFELQITVPAVLYTFALFRNKEHGDAFLASSYEDEDRVVPRIIDNGRESVIKTNCFVKFHQYAIETQTHFAYLMPKLYKSLVEYQEIFKLLIKVEVEFADDPFCSYNKTRHELIGKTLQRLYSTIAEVRENMVSVDIPVPQVSKNKNLQVLEMKVDAPQCLKNDYIAFRAYGNLLNNWYFEFRCPRGKKVITNNSRCAAYEAKLKEKKDKRNKNTER
ncbi:hypothetical protein HF086_004785 [Spodoptera exigua]|uniref:Uncharacterized protein n=1 Tax=Spodoptera exigua TaxID=7107 RepID=A0A922SAE6_SPOEX|nr:hypothetical protein HF086_004785 [Spodoptera exigua]